MGGELVYMNILGSSDIQFEEDSLFNNVETVPIKVLIGEQESYKSYDALMVVPNNVYIYGEQLNLEIRKALDDNTSVYIVDNKGDIRRYLHR